MEIQVSLIFITFAAAANVELTVQRNIKMSRPPSIMGPSTPLAQRSSINAPIGQPVPVDVSLFGQVYNNL
jgi:hypothetical protein